MEATQISTTSQTEKHNVVSTYNEMLFSLIFFLILFYF